MITLSSLRTGKLLLAAVLVLAVLTPKPGLAQGVQFSLNAAGIQGLSYNGQSFFDNSPTNGGGINVVSAMFRTPSGTENSYGMIANSLQPNLGSSTAVCTTDGASWFQQIYRSGQADQFTLKMVLTTPDTQTLQIDIYETNNDPTDTLAQIVLGYFLPLQLPGPATQYNNNVPMTLGAYDVNSQPAQFLSGSWGSLAIWQNPISNYATFWCSYGSAGQTLFDPLEICNYCTRVLGDDWETGVSTGTKYYEDDIAPGQTYHYTLYIRFSGSTTITSLALAPEAYAAYSQAYPYIVNWPDRSPIARWFMASPPDCSASNPRGYFSDSTLNVSDSAAFQSAAMSYVNKSIIVMNSMNPRPQGIIVWDLEGQEFNQYFTYVGDPSNLNVLAPEMDAVADQLFAAVTAAGYRVGMTIRTSTFGIGTQLPANPNYMCDPDGTLNYDMTDKFIDTAAAYPYQGYVCTGPNTWTQTGANEPHSQTVLDDDAEIISLLISKATYAHDRWGATMFYVDSNVWNCGVALFYQFFYQAQQQLPDCVFFPEHNSVGYWSCSAPFGQADQGHFVPPQAAVDIYPQAFMAIWASDVVASNTQAVTNAIKAGNIYFVDGWYNNPLDAPVFQCYLDAYSGSAAPKISTQPASQTVAVGQAATFSVVAAGTPLLNYQWQENGTAIPGATSASYTLSAAAAGDNGTVLSVVVSNFMGQVTSANASLTVTSSSGSTCSISGTVTLDGTGLSGVLVSDGAISATTNSSGNYSLTDVSNGAYTLTPSLAGYSFMPSTQALTVSNENVSQDFTATASQNPTYSISGTVTLNNNTLAGVIVACSAGSAATNSFGNYSITGLPNGSYTLTPFFSGCTFNPANPAVIVNNANATQIFTVTINPEASVAMPTFNPAPGAYTITQTVTISCAISGAIIYYTTDGTTPTASSAQYSAPISISASAQLQAIAIEAGASSLICSGVYNIVGSSNYVPDTYNDTDGNGYADEIKTALGISLNNASATPLNMPVGITPLALTLSKLSVKLNFAQTTCSDSIQVSGSLPIPSGFAANNQTMVVDVGGVVKIFTLNSKGNGAAATGFPAVTSAKNDHFSLKFKSVKGKVNQQTGTFTAQFNKGSFASAFADVGLLGSASVKNVARTVPVIILFNSKMYQTAQAVQYTATANKSGAAIKK